MARRARPGEQLRPIATNQRQRSRNAQSWPAPVATRGSEQFLVLQVQRKQQYHDVHECPTAAEATACCTELSHEGFPGAFDPRASLQKPDRKQDPAQLLLERPLREG